MLISDIFGGDESRTFRLTHKPHTRLILHIQITTHYKIFFRLTHLPTNAYEPGQDVCCLTRSLGKRGSHADTIQARVEL